MLNNIDATKTFDPKKFLTLNQKTQTFIAEQIHFFSDGMSGQELQKKLHIPFLRLPLPNFDYNTMLSEALSLEQEAVAHRSKDSYGWKSLCLHGIEHNKTLSSDRYGFTSELDAPYKWTTVSEQAPESTRFLKELLKQKFFEKFFRVRFMYLEPGGEIHFHRDRDENNKSLGPLNIALNMPSNCYWIFENWGTVPFEPGSGYAVDISNRHGVWNQSSETRVHIIVHGKYGPQYYKAIEDAFQEQKLLIPKKTKSIQKNISHFDCVLWNWNNEIDNSELFKKCSNITEHFIRLKANRHHRLISGIKLSSLLQQSAERGTKWALVSTPGVLYKDQFFSQARAYLSSLEDQNTFLVAHLLDRKERWFGIHPQCFFINIELWDKLGRPSFGAIEGGLELPNVLRSPENIHDDYTPVYLRRDVGTNIIKPQVFGWNWIRAALNANYSVLNFPKTLRERKSFLYPEQNQENLLQRLNTTELSLDAQRMKNTLSSHQEEVYEQLHIEAHGHDKKIFLFNTEQVRSPYQDGRVKKIDIFCGLPAGFMDMHLLQRHQFQQDCELIYFDINQSMLAIKKAVYEYWNGDNFEDFLQKLCEEQPAIFAHKLLTVDKGDMGAKWLEELSHWGSKENFLSTFNKVKPLKKTFLHMDVVKNQEPLLKMLSLIKNKHIALWYSNCFNYTPSLAALDWNMSSLRESGIQFINSISRLAKKNNLKVTVYGEDVSDACKTSSFGTDIYEVIG